MKKFAVLSGIVAFALFFGIAGNAVKTAPVEAVPDDILALNPTIVNILGGDINDDGVFTDWSLTVADNLEVPSATEPNCDPNPCGLAQWDLLNGDDDGRIEPSDFEAVDLDANQLDENSGVLWILLFVSNDDNVTMDADEGVFAAGDNNSELTAAECVDEDCDADGTEADDVVVVSLVAPPVINALNPDADRGDAELVATQGGEDIFLDYVVVGDPDAISLVAIEDTIQEDANAACDVGDFEDEIGLVDVGGLIATVEDDDGTPLTGVLVAWTSDDTDVVDVGLATTVSLDVEELGGPVALNLACAGDTGVATVKADITVDDAEIEITVVGAPADMALTAESPITCDGTTASTVTATLTDSEGNPVVAGNMVRFEVVALGVADPINAETDATGVATSEVTPLSGVSAGVVVNVTVWTINAQGNLVPTTLEDSIRIDCTALPPVVPPVAPPPVVPPTVIPPPTGDGGYLP